MQQARTKRWRKRGSTSVGAGGRYDNALAETINGLYKAEVIHRAGHGGRSRLSSSRRWSGWTGSTIAGCWSHRQHPAAEAEERYYAMTEQPAMAA